MQTFRLHAPSNILVSYCSVDWRWAEWITWQLEDVGHTTTLYAWSFEEQGSKMTLNMQELLQRADILLVIVSPDYLNFLYTQPEWETTFKQQLIQKKQKLLLVHIYECKHHFRGPIASLPCLDLVRSDEVQAREMLLTFVDGDHKMAPMPPAFPIQGKQANTHASMPATPLSPWNVPYPRNPFFTGGKQQLQTLHNALHKNADVQPQALYGPRGIGKTALALEYAYRYREEYQAVLWVQANSYDLFRADLSALCTTLHLPEQDEPDQHIQCRAVKRWLQEHTQWLLILDNVEDFAIIHDLLPLSAKGALLLTTHTAHTVQVRKVAQCCEVGPMDAEIAVLFLLRRSRRIAKDTPFEDIAEGERQAALGLVRQLDCIPLALQQAAAYIEQTGCTLMSYLELYRQLRIKLLKTYHALLSTQLEPLVVTWFLAFKKLAQTHPLAVELLRFCAILAADEMPEMLVTEAINSLDVFLQTSSETPSVEASITQLQQFALISSHQVRKTLLLPHYIQQFLLYDIDAEAQQQYAERAIQIVDRVFPDDEYLPWQQSFLYLLHARACLKLIAQWRITTLEAAHFLSRIGSYLLTQARYAEAELFFKQALDIWEGTQDPRHAQLVQLLTNLGTAYEGLGLYAQAEPLYERALVIDEQKWGVEHLNVAASLNNLAALYSVQGKYTQAEPLYLRAIALYEAEREPGHADLAISFNNLAALYYMQGQYAPADQLCQQALAIWESQEEQEHPYRIPCLNNAARLLCSQAKYVQAEQLFKRALQLCKTLLGSEHPFAATVLNNLGELYHIQDKCTQAEAAYQQALSIREQRLGASHPEIAITLNNLTRLYYDQGRYVQAELLCKRAFGICTQTVGMAHPTTTLAIRNQAMLYRARGQYVQALARYEQALEISQRMVVTPHPHIASLLHEQAVCYHLQGNYTQAETLYQQALTMREQIFGSQHPDVALTLHQLARLYYEQAKYGQMQPLAKVASTPDSYMLFPPDRANTLNDAKNVILFHPDKKKYTEAEQLYQRTLSILIQAFGSQHRAVAQTLEHYAMLLRKSSRSTEAAHLEERIRTIRKKWQEDELLQA